MRRLLLCLLLWLAALPARAQDEPATLVADRVFLTAGDTLTAEGAVEVFYRGARLAARRIVYDGATAELTIEGPITLTDGPPLPSWRSSMRRPYAVMRLSHPEAGGRPRQWSPTRWR